MATSDNNCETKPKVTAVHTTKFNYGEVMRVWKLTRGELEPFICPEPVPDWMIDREAIQEGKRSEPTRCSEITLARYEVALDGKQKTFLLARSAPSPELIHQIQRLESALSSKQA
jgi:hypothetical protein